MAKKMTTVRVDSDTVKQIKEEDVSVNEYLTTAKDYIDSKNIKVVKRIKNCPFVCEFKKDCFNYYDRPCPKLERAERNKKTDFFETIEDTLLVKFFIPKVGKRNTEITDKSSKIRLLEYINSAKKTLEDMEALEGDEETINNYKRKIREAEEKLNEMP